MRPNTSTSTRTPTPTSIATATWFTRTSILTRIRMSIWLTITRPTNPTPIRTTTQPPDEKVQEKQDHEHHH